ncbi:hypothetical protein ASE21_14545 [Flavobacterium sp. Root901]|uniref:hypothetical protein n=1 Tax=Flavobacterium sp. Root901 TaxID=1736605 RepID=UPI00070BFF4A|nr:hypothetical protein [Flavobacterium sp. Root901]KRD09067.1 hypothetical protein ASE21_14545 [Flavobacterium sp. Root901]
MADINLELSIYTFTLNEKFKREDYFDFNEFYRKNFSKNGENPHTIKPEELYNRFVGMILDEFHNKFWLNKDENKGISTKNIKYRHGRNIIEGIINGGNTGYGHQIYDILDNENTVGEISEKQLASLPYYFKMWTPPDSQVGVLMIQSYSIGSIGSILIEFLTKIFAKYGTSFRRIVHVPNELRENYLKRSSVQKVTFTSTIENRNSRKKFNRAFEDSEGLKVTITVEGLKKKNIFNFFKDFNSKKPIGLDLAELGMENAEDYQTKIYYKDEHGRKAHATIRDKFKIQPTIVLPLEISNTNKTPNLEKISEFTDGLLEKVKQEINY